jgi:glutaredoxin
VVENLLLPEGFDMTITPSPVFPMHKLVRAAVVGVALGALATSWASAQGVYRIVGPDGKVTYSDQPPPPSARASVVDGASASAAVNNPQLPQELRQTVSRYPVTLYTTTDCAPCNTGRSLLNARGVPYTEKTVTSAEDAAALKRLSGESSLPFLSIGGQQLKGFSETDWTQYLDAAGYPKQSVLPTNFRRPAATALVATQPVQAAAARPNAVPARPPVQPAETPVTPPTENPAGIRF